ncbi:maleylpyruvate isomerase N-terminal domain-containing protein [Vallicoccus soli]|uniref:Mycothiol-dependent maleylpyruvate isomerase metal-binding domain-containing protein n=1 Tax=Vallicoccus soli TaxID=2339232 RepID=A0A3A3YXE3_9ACTN|nr:maleylpyruvate isomerase N-terminal domain-containing protein [Vallicoccus soli]RJK96318.1 hypothetical protein D5H78_08705 [Vallicoccus soli]
MVADLVAHLLLDAQRALRAAATPADGPPDTDAVTYWRAEGAPDDPAGALAHAWHVRRAASAYARPDGLLAVWRDTAAAAVRAVAAAPPVVATQGHRLRRDDLVATLCAEAAAHHLDLVVDLPGAPGPSPDVLAALVRALDGLAALAGGAPPAWAPERWALVGTGRERPTAAEAAGLGPLAGRLPLLG